MRGQFQFSAELRWGEEMPISAEKEAVGELQSQSGGFGEAEVPT